MKTKEAALVTLEQTSIWGKVHESQLALQIPFEGPRLNVPMHGALEKEERLSWPLTLVWFVSFSSSFLSLLLFFLSLF